VLRSEFGHEPVNVGHGRSERRAVLNQGRGERTGCKDGGLLGDDAGGAFELRPGLAGAGQRTAVFDVGDERLDGLQNEIGRRGRSATEQQHGNGLGVGQDLVIDRLGLAIVVPIPAACRRHGELSRGQRHLDLQRARVR
jgi:hypothetical protein